MSKAKLPKPKQARLKAGLTAARLAELADCSIRLVWKCEKSGNYPTNQRYRNRYLFALGIIP